MDKNIVIDKLTQLIISSCFSILYVSRIFTDHTPYLPTMTKPHPDVPPVDLEIELLSGQRLCFWKKKCSTLTVEIHTYGIPHDTGKMEPPATAVSSCDTMQCLGIH